MRRDPASVRGFVRFPADDPRYEHTNEGGMFVCLAVLHPERSDWMMCCGGDYRFTYEEMLVGNATGAQALHKLFPKMVERADALKAGTALEDVPDETADDMTSVPVLAVMTIGSTGWSGWNVEKQRLWECTEDDLTDEGKAFMAMLRRLYEGCEIVLSTWLDT